MNGNKFRFTFIMDQQVGLKTAAMNLERFVREDAEVTARFIPVQYQAAIGPLAMLPLPEGIKGTLRGIREIRTAISGYEPSDAILWGTWAAKSVLDIVDTTPAFLRMDMTPVQMKSMGKEYNYSAGRANLLQGWKRRATLRLYRAANHLFPWSHYVANSLIRDYDVPKDKITVIPPGTDVEQFRPDLERRSALPKNVVRLLFVGGDFRRKGGDLLLDWMAKRDHQQGPRVELHFVTRDEVPEAKTIPGIVVHHGITNNSPELVALYQESDLFVLPTRADCFSLVAMEAMAAGLPVIISSLGGIPDIVKEEETGYLMEPEDSRTMANYLERLIADGARRHEMGIAARERACTHFDSRLCTARLLQIMKTKSALSGK